MDLRGRIIWWQNDGGWDFAPSTAFRGRAKRSGLAVIIHRSGEGPPLKIRASLFQPAPPPPRAAKELQQSKGLRLKPGEVSPRGRAKRSGLAVIIHRSGEGPSLKIRASLFQPAPPPPRAAKELQQSKGLRLKPGGVSPCVRAKRSGSPHTFRLQPVSLSSNFSTNGTPSVATCSTSLDLCARHLFCHGLDIPPGKEVRLPGQTSCGDIPPA